MADPAGRVLIAFDDAPLIPAPTWTRIDTLDGCRVRDWQIDRGRPNEFEKTGTGTAVVRIVDRSGQFDPTNLASPYLDKLTPGRQAAIGLQNPVSDEWFTLFRGFVESWSYVLDQTRQYMELELSLVDGFAILARAELIVGEDGALPLPAEIAAGNVGYGETLGSVKDRIDGILGDVGWPVELRDVFSGNVRVGPKVYGPGTSALDAIWDAVDAEFPGVGNAFMSKDGLFLFRGRQARFRPDVAEYGIQRRTVGDPSATSLDADVVPVSELEFVNGYDGLVNAATATPQGVGSGSDWRPLDPDVDDVAAQYVKDAVSIEEFGLCSITFDNLQTIAGIATGSDSLEETKRFATYYVQNFSAPTSRISRLVFKSRRPGAVNGSALWLHLCKCEISDLLTVSTFHPGGGGFQQDFYVEGIHYTCRPGHPLYPVVELALDVSPAAHYTTNPFDDDEDP